MNWRSIFGLSNIFWHLTTAWKRRLISTLFLPGKESIMRYKWFNRDIFIAHIHLLTDHFFNCNSYSIYYVFIRKWSRSIEKVWVIFEKRIYWSNGKLQYWIAENVYAMCEKVCGSTSVSTYVSSWLKLKIGKLFDSTDAKV